jgi:hypothetical protein
VRPLLLQPARDNDFAVLKQRPFFSFLLQFRDEQPGCRGLLQFVMRNLLQFRDDAEARDDVVAKGYALLCAAYPRSD